MLRAEEFQPGARVRVTQQMPFGTQNLCTTVEGVIVRYGQQKTGSWYAHARDDKFWLDRLELLLRDGEKVIVNLDQYSRVQALEHPASPLGASRPSFS